MFPSGSEAASVSATAPIVPHGLSSHTHYAADRLLEVPLYLFGQIAGSDAYVGDSAGGKSLHIVVYDGLALYLQERFRGVFCERAQAFALASGHKHGFERKAGALPRQVEHPFEVSVAVEHGDKHNALAAVAAECAGVDCPLCHESETAHRGIGCGTVERGATEQGAPYVAVGEGSGHFAVRLSHEQLPTPRSWRHSIALTGCREAP